MSGKMRKISFEVIFQLFCAAVAAVMLFPVFYALSVSFMEHRHVLSRPPNLIPPTFTMDNYIHAFNRTPLMRYMYNSFVVAAICSVTRILLASMAAYAYVFYRFRGRRILFALTMATMMIPHEILIVSNFTTLSRMGLINTYAGLSAVFLIHASNIFLFRQSFLSFAMDIRDAALIDGCGNFQFYYKILMPISKPIITTVLISSFVFVWNQYVWPLMVTNRTEMRTVQVGITMLKDRESTVFGPVMAGVVVAMIPTILIFIIFQKKIVAGMMSGAVKG